MKMDGVSPEITLHAIKKAFERIKNYDLSHSPAFLATQCIREASRYFATDDPYRQAKKEQNELALQALDELKDMVLSSDDVVKSALLMSASGNIIDLGTQDTFDFHGTFRKNQAKGFVIDDYPLFREKLKEAKSLLLVADNCGEVVFDLFFLNILPKTIKKYIGVKSGPVLNDATVEDLKGLDVGGVQIVETGSDALGVLFDEVSEEFRTIFDSTDIVIAKGHANFETLDQVDREVFLLLQVKCSVVGKRLDAEVGDTVFVMNHNLRVDF